MSLPESSWKVVMARMDRNLGASEVYYINKCTGQGILIGKGVINRKELTTVLLMNAKSYLPTTRRWKRAPNSIYEASFNNLTPSQTAKVEKLMYIVIEIYSFWKNDYRGEITWWPIRSIPEMPQPRGSKKDHRRHD